MPLLTSMPIAPPPPTPPRHALTRAEGGEKVTRMLGVRSFLRSRQRLPLFRSRDRRLPQPLRGLAAMQRLADFADGEEGAGPRLLDFQRLLAAAPNQPDQPIEKRQRRLRRLAFGRFQGFDNLGGLFGISHALRSPAATSYKEPSSSAKAGDPVRRGFSIPSLTSLE